MSIFRKTMTNVLFAALAFMASNVYALSIGMDFTAYVTMLDPLGNPLQNSSFLREPKYHGWRTAITGKMVMNIDPAGLHGSATFDPFLFMGSLASGQNVNFVPVATVLNTPTGTLLLGNMSFNWGLNTGIPVSICSTWEISKRH